MEGNKRKTHFAIAFSLAAAWMGTHCGSGFATGAAEGIIYADIDLGVIPGLKYEIDPAGHYSNKTLTMTLDTTPKPVTTFIGKAVDTSVSYEEIQAVEE